MKRMLVCLFAVAVAISTLPLSSIAQSRFSIEAGPAYIYNYSFGGDAKTYENARGGNIGFNYRFNPKAFLHAQFGFMSFPFLGLYYKTRSTSDLAWRYTKHIHVEFYSISLALRFLFREKGITPIFAFGPGIHLVNESSGEDKFVPYINSLMVRGYYSVAGGVMVPVIDKFDIIFKIDLYHTTGKREYLFMPVILTLKYNF